MCLLTFFFYSQQAFSRTVCCLIFDTHLAVILFESLVCCCAWQVAIAAGSELHYFELAPGVIKHAG